MHCSKLLQQPKFAAKTEGGGGGGGERTGLKMILGKW